MDPSSSTPHRQDDPVPSSSSPWSAPWTANPSTSSSSSGYTQPGKAPPLPPRLGPFSSSTATNTSYDDWPALRAHQHDGQPGPSRRSLAPPQLDSPEPFPALNQLRIASPPVGPSSKEKERATFIDSKGDVLYWRTYLSEEDDMDDIMRLTEQELSEPYNIFTFRYFLHEWPHLTIMVYASPDSNEAIATIIGKQENHAGKIRSASRGYIGMLSVDRAWRRRGIATRLVQLIIDEMVHRGVDEVVLETEHDNVSSLALYKSLGFIREKRLQRFYTNCKDAFRLILPTNPIYSLQESPSEADMARWMVGSGPDEDPKSYQGPGPATSGRSDTPLPSTNQQYDDMYT